MREVGHEVINSGMSPPGSCRCPGAAPEAGLLGGGRELAVRPSHKGLVSLGLNAKSVYPSMELQIAP